MKADIAQISAEVAGRVLDVHVRDHAEVRAGDVLLTLDPEPFRVALAKAEAELDATRGQVRTLIATWHEAKSELQEAESKVAYWNAQLARQKTLAGARHRRLQQVRGDREQRHRGRGSRRRHAQEDRARGGPAGRQPGAADRPASDGAREAGGARAGRARSGAHHHPRAARRHGGQRAAAEGRADQGGDGAVRAGGATRGPGWRRTSRRPSSPT